MNIIADINSSGENWVQVTLSGEAANSLTADYIERLFQGFAPPPSTHVRPITLDVLRDYFKAMDAGDVPDQALALYSYLLMDGFIDKEAAKTDVRATLHPDTWFDRLQEAPTEPFDGQRYVGEEEKRRLRLKTPAPVSREAADEE